MDEPTAPARVRGSAGRLAGQRLGTRHSGRVPPLRPRRAGANTGGLAGLHDPGFLPPGPPDRAPALQREPLPRAGNCGRYVFLRASNLTSTSVRTLTGLPFFNVGLYVKVAHGTA